MIKLHVEEVCFSAASIAFGYLLSIWASIYIVSEKEVVAVRPRWIMVDRGIESDRVR